MKKLRGLYVLDQHAATRIYGELERADIARHVEIYAPDQTAKSVIAEPSILNAADVIFSGWGAPVLRDELLAHAPNLKVFFYGAGATGGILTSSVWERGVQITSAIAANAVPVAEFTLANILLAMKHFLRLAREARELKTFPDAGSIPGSYGGVVGIISLGTIARHLLTLLTPFSMKIFVYDPFLSADEAEELGVERASLDLLFGRSDVVSLHTPWLRETEGMIGASHFTSMKPGATFINTSRGAVVREPELIECAMRRPDLQFILDVMVKEPPDPDSKLYTLPNVVITPHIAGSVGNECRRMGRYMVDELERYIAGKPLRWAVTKEGSKKFIASPDGLREPSGYAAGLSLLQKQNYENCRHWQQRKARIVSRSAPAVGRPRRCAD